MTPNWPADQQIKSRKQISFPDVEEHGASLPWSQWPASVTYPEPDESNPQPPTRSLQSILKSCSHLSLGRQSGLIPSGFPTKFLQALNLSSYTCHVPRQSDPPKVVIIDECHRLWGISFCNFLQSKLVWIYGDKHFSIASEYWWGRWAYMIRRFMFQRWR